MGPVGRYRAVASPSFKVDYTTAFENPSARSEVRGADAALGALVSALVRDGWQPQETRGQYWYSHRLRRQAVPRSLGLPPAPGQASTVAPGSRKSLGLAYVFWLLLGLIGGHRYYMGRFGTAVLQTLTIGGLGIWWLIDLFLLPGMVRRNNGEG
ncbi:MAG: TM2 domain-containing protein [Thermomicrobiales bacterium]